MLFNRTFLWRCLCCYFAPWYFCWYRGFCHRTGSDLLLFVFVIFVQEFSFLMIGVALSLINSKLCEFDINYAIFFSIISGNTIRVYLYFWHRLPPSAAKCSIFSSLTTPSLYVLLLHLSYIILFSKLTRISIAHWKKSN